ncbi:GNAT family N-acetyltransferase [Nesterenkonia sphaerica]|uniref:GNAT family N-acetyltransferase n=1 Tax=Nesterenkonia sphaerica TaxID=1804988 RepID=A0A5R9A880_9MICC|nr:GNAT family protein [Nesterenkonia sphaerica]TLP74205.1 GNAT family N-acetyltransferase [Nesterenkonia sphaerica]
MSSPHLRALSCDDAASVLAAFQADPAHMALQGEVTDRRSACTYIELLTDSAEGNCGFALDVGRRCVGVVGINAASQHRLGWFFYWTHPLVRGRGLASAAAASVANWALTSRERAGGGFERLELGHRADNPASGAVARAAGFLREGTERRKLLIDGQRIDVHTYGRLRWDPPPRTAGLALE